MPWMKSIWKKIMIKHRVIQSLTEILIKNISFKKNLTRLLWYFSQCLPLDFWRELVQYSDKFMPGIVLYCLHITILYKSHDNNKEQSKTMRNLPKPWINFLEYWTTMDFCITVSYRSDKPLTSQLRRQDSKIYKHFS